jgi:DNA-binding GntR family transcriptional regulator
VRPLDGPQAQYAQFEGAVAFRLFADRDDPTMTVPEQIAARIGDRIIAGELEPGARIVEQELAAGFRVSRGPIRDAIRILEREGLATIHARRGAVVTELSVDEVREISEMRAALLETAARKNAVERSPELLAALAAGVAQLDRLARLDDDGGQYAETVYRLSIISARACGNRRLARTVTALSLQTLRYSKLGLASRTRRQASLRLWKSALAALRRGDTEAYVSLTRQRVEASGAEAARALQQSTPSPGASR